MPGWEKPLLAVRGLSKSFPGVQALKAVDFDVRAGEVHALIGENGAGKSTLIKVLAGAHRRDAGEVLLCGEGVEFRDPHAALRAGISVIYQEFNLVPTLSVAQNLFLGREPRVFPGVLDRQAMERQAAALMAELGVAIDPGSPVRALGVAERQMVEIAKALSRSAQIVIMDEPTAPLTAREIEVLFAAIGRLKAQGIGIIYITHRIDEVFSIADRVTVLRDGVRILTDTVARTDVARLVFAMVGRHIEEHAAPLPAVTGPCVLEAENLSDGQRVRGVSLRVHAGEVLGLAGLVGSGRSELAQLLFGVTPPTAGTVRLGGRPLGEASVARRIRAGLGMVPEDRKLQGLVLQMLVRDNVTLATLPRYTRCGLLRRGLQEGGVRRLMEGLRIHARGPRHPVRALSGGNQQKVILARWLDAGARALILDEPTRGVDVGAKMEIYDLIRGLQARGVAILLISSDLPEVLRLSDRVTVMRQGRIVGGLPRAAASQEAVLRLMIGTGDTRTIHPQGREGKP